MKRDAAIEVLLARFARHPDRIARFEREARAASLSHPNICVIHEVGEDGDQPIAMEFLEGRR